MPITTAQLTGAITASQIQFGLTGISTNQSGLPAVGALPLPVGNPMFIDGELMFCYAQPAAGIVLVRGRGSDGTAAQPHDVTATVSVSASPADFNSPIAGEVITLDPALDQPLSIATDQTLSLPFQNTTYILNKVTALALVLPPPAPYMNGLQLRFTSSTAVAHVITAASLFMDGTGTLPHSTATFNAKQGATLNVLAETGAGGSFWNVISANNVSIS